MRLINFLIFFVLLTGRSFGVVATSPINVNTMAELKALPGGIYAEVNLLGYAAPADGGGGLLRWNASSTAAPDSCSIYKPNSNPTKGRWIRAMTGYVTAQGCGTAGNATHDDIMIGASDTALAPLHIIKYGEGLNVKASDLSHPHYPIVCEAEDATVGLFSLREGDHGSAIDFAEMFPAGTLVDKWDLCKSSSNASFIQGSKSSLFLEYGNNADYALNRRLFEFTGYGYLKFRPRTGSNGGGLAMTSAGQRLQLSSGTDSTPTNTEGAYINVMSKKYGGQEGDISFLAGDTSANGRIRFFTGATQERMRIAYDGTITAFQPFYGTTLFTSSTAGIGGYDYTAPAISNTRLGIENSSSSSGLALVGHQNGGATGHGIWSWMSGGTKTVPLPTPSSTVLLGLNASGFNDTGYITSAQGRYAIFANTAWSATNRGTFHTWSGTPAASTTLAEWMRLIDGSFLIGTTNNTGEKLIVGGSERVAAATSTTAGGSTVGLLFGSSAPLGVYFGSGAPTITAGKGAIYLRTDGTGSNNRAYVNSSASTTWVPLSTSETSAFTITLTGCTTVPSVTVRGTITGNIAAVTIPAMSGTSNATTMTLDGWPAAFQPANTNYIQGVDVLNSGTVSPGQVNISATNSWTVNFKASFNASPAGIFTNTGTKGMNNDWTLVYPLH